MPYSVAGTQKPSQNKPIMKKVAYLLTLFGIAGMNSACLYSPEVTYTYWRYSPTTQMYSAVRTEMPLSADEMREQGLSDKLPENAKTFEAR